MENRLAFRFFVSSVSDLEKTVSEVIGMLRITNSKQCGTYEDPFAVCNFTVLGTPASKMGVSIKETEKAQMTDLPIEVCGAIET